MIFVCTWAFLYQPRFDKDQQSLAEISVLITTIHTASKFALLRHTSTVQLRYAMCLLAANELVSAAPVSSPLFEQLRPFLR